MATQKSLLEWLRAGDGSGPWVEPPPAEFREVSRSSPTGLGQEAESIITNTVSEAEPLLAYDPDSGRLTMANFAIEPQSPVIIPKPEVLIPSLGLFNEGALKESYIIGALVLSYLIAPFLAWAALRGLLLAKGRFDRTYKTGRVTRQIPGVELGPG